MTTIVEFLTAQLDELQSGILNGWDSDGEARVATVWTGGTPGYTTVASDHRDGIWIADGREVIEPRHVHVLFDPAYVIADIRAKRRIIELHSGGHECSQYDHHGEVDSCTYSHDFEDCSTLRLLALSFAGHPDYQQGWAL